MSGLGSQDCLVSTAWVHEHLASPELMVVEVAEGEAPHGAGHVPGAVAWRWSADLRNPSRHDIPDREQMGRLLGGAGIDNYSTVVLYGPENNASAAYAFWLLTMYGHGPVRVMDGGRAKWTDEGRPLTTVATAPLGRTYRASPPDSSLRATRDYVLGLVRSGAGAVLADARSRRDLEGHASPAPGHPGVPAVRQGRIPGAISVPWPAVLNADLTFKSPEELARLLESRGITPRREVITYCSDGRHASLVWFAMSQLLGYAKVRLYDGSWAEYQGLIGAPMEASGPHHTLY